MTDDADIFFDGVFDVDAVFNGTDVRAIFEDEPAPSTDGFQPRPGRWARVYVRASDLDYSPGVHDKIVDTDETEWNVQQVTREGNVWLLLCLAEQRHKTK